MVSFCNGPVNQPPCVALSYALLFYFDGRGASDKRCQFETWLRDLADVHRFDTRFLADNVLRLAVARAAFMPRLVVVQNLCLAACHIFC